MDKELRRMLVYIAVALSTYYFIKNFFPEEPEKIPDSNTDVVDVRGGDLNAPRRLLFARRIGKFLLRDKAFKGAILSVVAIAINNELLDDLVDSLIKCSPSIIVDPSKKLPLLSPTTKTIMGSTALAETKKAILTAEITDMNKIKLLKLKLLFLKAKFKYIFKSLKGKKRIQFVLLCVSLIGYLASNNTPLFAFLSTMLREILKDTPITEDFDDYFN